ncbi:MAG: hypothetical protein KGQ38_04955 [Actinomycetales bacterium]|nr:hypothetical protein [Actinomycetales bacterium]
MLIDCQTCVVRDLECGDCVVTALLGPMPTSLDQELPVLKVLADAGLTKPLRLIKGEGQSGTNAAEDRNTGASAIG